MPAETFTTRTLITLVAVAVIGLGVYCIFASHPTRPASRRAPTHSVSFACDGGKTIDADFYPGSATPSAIPGGRPELSGRVALTLSDGRTMTLPQVISADGARYQSPDGAFEFWTKGNGAFILEHNQQTYRGCVVVAPASTAAAPRRGGRAPSLRKRTRRTR